MTGRAYSEDHDGIEVVSLESGDVVHFVPCRYEGRMRERVMMGMLRNLGEQYFLRDTRDAA